MEVRAKKALGQHFLTDQKVARAIVDALVIPSKASVSPFPVLEGVPGKGDTLALLGMTSASTMALATFWSVRKCCPRAFFARTSMLLPISFH